MTIPAILAKRELPTSQQTVTTTIPILASNNYSGQLESSFCLPSEVEKNGKCYIRRKPGEACEYSEQCMNIGDIEYYCIGRL